jgi:hypothetical protein
MPLKWCRIASVRRFAPSPSQSEVNRDAQNGRDNCFYRQLGRVIEGIKVSGYEKPNTCPNHHVGKPCMVFHAPALSLSSALIGTRFLVRQ